MKTNFLKLFLCFSLCGLFMTIRAGEAEKKWAFDNLRRYSGIESFEKQSKEKRGGVETFRERYSVTAYRKHSMTPNLDLQGILDCWSEDGTFSDLEETKEGVFASNNQSKIGLYLVEAFNRIWLVAEEFRADRMGTSLDRKIYRKLKRAIVYYGNLEVNRSNKVHRFHESCFAMPTAAVNTYFCFLKQMDEAEKGKSKDTELTAACNMLKVIGLQAWTQPLRNDSTDNNVVQIARFRKHVWWVGGNALAYRSLLPVAAMLKSVPMIDLLREVAQKGIDFTSQPTYDSAFWTEGGTADGAGWGHGKQCLVWGYPMDGSLNALGMLSSFKGTPWECKLTERNKQALFTYLRGSNWFYYKGYVSPYFDRMTSNYNPARTDIRTLSLVRTLLKDWTDSFSADERQELADFQREAERKNVNMSGYGKGVYEGTRWFFNNDKLIKKNARYHIIVNMASVRCDGLESAAGFADEYNFYPTDGMTLFQKRGDEYKKVVGAFDVTMTPGVTAREGMDKLTPVTNWRGYCSKHNFAVGTTGGGDNAVAGYIFEKMDASTKDNVNDKGQSAGKNALLYGVKAYKSYFMMGDYMLALGAGITNLDPEMEGTIRTTIDNTLHESQLTAMQGGKQIPVGKGVWSFFVGEKPVWVIQQGKFAYTVLPEYTKNAYFVYEPLATEWNKRSMANAKKKDLPKQINTVRLWIDHSQKPVNDTYGYVVYAGEELLKEDLPFTVLRNDTLVQAAKAKDGSVIEAVFYDKASKLETDGVALSVSYPCAVLIEKEDGNERLSVTDATMNTELKDITVNYNGKDVIVPMPQGEFCGKSVTVSIN